MAISIRETPRQGRRNEHDFCRSYSYDLSVSRRRNLDPSNNADAAVSPPVPPPRPDTMSFIAIIRWTNPW